MRQGKWIHILIATSAAFLIIYQNQKQPDGLKRGSAEMVPLRQIISWPEPAFSIAEPVTIARPSHSPQISARYSLQGHSALAKDSEKDPSVIEQLHVPEAAPGSEAALAAAAEESAERSLIKTTAAVTEVPLRLPMAESEERVHREVVAMIKHYLQEHRALGALDARPVNLASASNLGRMDMNPQRRIAVIPARLVIGFSAGPRRTIAAQTRLPQPWLGSDLFAGYEYSRWLRLGLNIGMNQMRWKEPAALAAFALIHGDLQVELFLKPGARLRPFVLIGGGAGQMYATSSGLEGAGASVSKVAARTMVVGAGAEYRIVPRLGAQVVLAYRYMEQLQTKGASGGGQGVWEVKAGLTISMGRAATSSDHSPGGLAAIK